VKTLQETWRQQSKSSSLQMLSSGHFKQLVQILPLLFLLSLGEMYLLVDELFMHNLDENRIYV